MVRLSEVYMLNLKAPNVIFSWGKYRANVPLRLYGMMKEATSSQT